MKILCLIGTSPYSFRRLVEYVDLNLGKKFNVTIQKGETDYECKNCFEFTFCDRNKILKLISESDIIISQGGYGSMMDAISLNKKIIAVPRMIKYNETLHDQVEHVSYLASKNFLVPCYKISELESLLNMLICDKISLSKYTRENQILISSTIENYLNQILI